MKVSKFSVDGQIDTSDMVIIANVEAPKMIIFALDLLQGLFLLHHPSRSIMSINSNMRVCRYIYYFD